MPYQYGEAFARLGVMGMGRQGASWCGIDPDGVLVLMSHQNYYRKENGVFLYRTPNHERRTPIASSVTRSRRMIAEYFEPGRKIILAIGVFDTDGGALPDGRHEPSKFREATGQAYRATMREFDENTGRLVCEIVEKFDF
jgi:hypothetical protein